MRAIYRDVVIDPAGRPIPDAEVAVLVPGDTALFAPIYASGSGATQLSNPIIAGANGEIQFFLDTPQAVDLRVTVGNTTRVVPVHVNAASTSLSSDTAIEEVVGIGLLSDDSSRFSVTAGGSVRSQDGAGGEVSIASAASLTLPEGLYIRVTGTTGITSIVADSTTDVGRLVVLRFTGSLTVTDGGNLVLAGNFTAANGRTLTLISNGASWFEVARGVN